MQLNDTVRQGDVLLRKIAKLPEHLVTVSRDNGRVVLANGERTGHAHAFSSSRVAMFKDTGTGSGQHTYITVSGEKNALLTHEEHPKIAVPPGDYEVVVQREETWSGTARAWD